jgi:hypothetical protein
VVSDKHKALRRAVREVFPHAYKQPCLAHKMHNILCKLPRKAQKGEEAAAAPSIPCLQVRGGATVGGSSSSGSKVSTPQPWSAWRKIW